MESYVVFTKHIEPPHQMISTEDSDGQFDQIVTTKIAFIDATDSIFTTIDKKSPIYMYEMVPMTMIVFIIYKY